MAVARPARAGSFVFWERYVQAGTRGYDVLPELQCLCDLVRIFSMLASEGEV